MNKDTAQLLITQNKKTYNSIAQNFSQTRNKIWPELGFFIKNYIKDGCEVLDVGCGNGRLLGAISENFNNFNYTGIDISEKLIDEAEKKSENSKYNSQFLTGDILNLPSNIGGDNKFDVIFCIAVLNHIPSQKLRELAIKNIFELLKPNGYLLMTNWNLWNFSSSKSWWKLKIPALLNGSIETNCKLDFKDVVTHWGQEKLPLYYHAFTKREIKKLLKINGFQIIENYYSLENKKVNRWKAKNLVTISQKQNIT